jgi:ubiquinol-cytochrome c reductase cytochrome b subunit
MGAIAFYGVLWLEGANDVVADHLDIPLYTTTRIAQVAIFVLPVVAYIVTKRICLGLQRKDLHLLEHGVETGIIRQLPSGEFIEETRPVTEEARAVLESRPEPLSLPPAESDVPAPAMRGATGRLRERLNEVVNESVPLTESDGYGGHGNGHGNGHAAEVGHGAEAEHAAVPAAGEREAGHGDEGGGGGYSATGSVTDQGDGQSGS